MGRFHYITWKETQVFQHPLEKSPEVNTPRYMKSLCCPPRKEEDSRPTLKSFGQLCGGLPETVYYWMALNSVVCARPQDHNPQHVVCPVPNNAAQYQSKFGEGSGIVDLRRCKGFVNWGNKMNYLIAVKLVFFHRSTTWAACGCLTFGIGSYKFVTQHRSTTHMTTKA